MVNKILYWAAAIIIVVIVALIVLTFTGFKSPAGENKCGVENCHGMDLNCGPNVPEACDAMYMLGDKCRQYAWCEVVEGQCSLVENKTFETCKSCVNECAQDNPNDPVALFQCESNCPNEIPSESDYCVDNFGNPQPAGTCAEIPLEARKCSSVGECMPTCANGCVNKNYDLSGIGDCKAIPQYSCECSNGFCIKK
jgi:hypothetical protein